VRRRIRTRSLRARVLLSAAALLIAGSCSNPTSPDSISRRASDSLLAATYAPILETAPGERFLPTRAESMLEVATLRSAAGDSLAGPPVALEDLLLRGGPGTALDLPARPLGLDDAADAAALFATMRARPEWRPVYYAAVLRNVAYFPPGLRSAYAGVYDVVLYFFFYLYNDWRSGTPDGANDHEGDWEGVTVYLLREGSRSRPVYVRYSRHRGSTAARWDATVPDSLGLVALVVSGADAREGTHLKVRVAKGSHANYPFAGEFATGTYTDLAPGGGERIVPEGADRSAAASPAPEILLFDPSSDATIFAYEGRWGAPGVIGFAGPFSPTGGPLLQSPLDALLDSLTNPYGPLDPEVRS
jgi:hypothetical protein